MNLFNIQEALAHLGHPEKAFSSIHVAGTNGKGSVTLKMAKALQMRGYKVGLYTSPHISSQRERIRINDELVDEEWFLKEKAKVPEKLTFFEQMTILAFLYFAEKNVDYAVIETGLGGRLDATNVILPKLSVITSIDLDHTQLLGSTIDQIAFEKGGIIKELVPLIVGPTANLKVLENLASEKRAPFIPVEGPFASYDEENSVVAQKALGLLIDNPPNLIGLKPPCRLEKIQNVVLDVAHNPAGMKRLFQEINPSVAVVGLSEDKDLKGVLTVLKAKVLEVHFVKTPLSRGADPELLKQIWETLPGDEPAFVYQTIEEGFLVAKGRGKPLVVTGSFYIMAPVRRLLGVIEPFDVEMIQDNRCILSA